MKKTTLILTTLILISSMLTFLEVFLRVHHAVGSGKAQTLWSLVFAVLIAMWCIEDARTRKYKLPYDYGTFIYFLWPIVLPYYLFATRRMAGVVIFVGFFGIYTIPFMLGLLVYYGTP